MKLSLIIATYNRSRQLPATLESVSRQSAPPEMWECIVVDNNSADDTRSVFAEFSARFPRLNMRIVGEERQGLSHARNRGIGESRGEYIAIIDDDERVNPEFVQSYIDLFESRPEVLVAGGRVIPEYPSGRPRWMSRYVEKPIANPTEWGGKVRPFPKGEIPAGGNMAFRRTVFDRFGLFEPTLGRTGTALTGGEESDLFERLGAAGVVFWYLPDAVIWHVIPASKLTKEYFQRLAKGTGASQRRRAVLHGRLARLYMSESVKWCATLLLALWHTLTLHPSKALWLLRLRWGITRGILDN